MKRITIVLLMMCSTLGFSQTWFDLGVKGGIGGGFLINNTINTDSRFGLLPQLNNFIGGKVGVNFGDMFGIAIDVDHGKYAYGFTQAMVIGKDQALTYNYKMTYNTLNVMPTLRYTKDASYVEIGPQFSFVKNKLIEDAAYGFSNSIADEALNNNLTGIVFGFGGHLIGSDVIALMMGLRFNYVLSNLTSDMYEETTFPFSNYPDITTASSSNPLNVQLVMELNYSLGYFVRASCGRRSAFLSF
jgi:hypothetical protein